MKPLAILLMLLFIPVGFFIAVAGCWIFNHLNAWAGVAYWFVVAFLFIFIIYLTIKNQTKK